MLVTTTPDDHEKRMEIGNNPMHSSTKSRMEQTLDISGPERTNEEKRDILHIMRNLSQQISNKSNQIELLAAELASTEASNLEKRSELMSQWKKWELSTEAFGKAAGVLEMNISNIRERISEFQSEIRLLQIESMNAGLVRDSKISAVESLHLETHLDEHLDQDIQAGGSNAQGVYTMKNHPYLVIRRSLKSYEFMGNLTYLTAQLDNQPRFPRTLQVFISNGSTYQVVEPATGTQVDTLPETELEAISQEHFDQFARDVLTLWARWIVIDPSKSSNFFYDQRIGFSFIDLAGWKANLVNLETYMRAIFRVQSGDQNTMAKKIRSAVNALSAD